MAYPALRQMAERNRARFGREVGPAQPYLSGGNGAGGDLKSAALRFLHERCEGLRFSDETAAQEAADGQYRGTSFLPNQIPYNMEMDLDRLCLERELERFIDSGAA